MTRLLILQYFLEHPVAAAFSNGHQAQRLTTPKMLSQYISMQVPFHVSSVAVTVLLTLTLHFALFVMHLEIMRIVEGRTGQVSILRLVILTCKHHFHFLSVGG